MKIGNKENKKSRLSFWFAVRRLCQTCPNLKNPQRDLQNVILVLSVKSDYETNN